MLTMKRQRRRQSSWTWRHRRRRSINSGTSQNTETTPNYNFFGTISSEEDWWSDDCVTYRNFINDLNALGPKDNINVLIQSQGGDVFAANAIYNALVANSAKITATIIGICASAATIIYKRQKHAESQKTAYALWPKSKSNGLWSLQADDLRNLAEATDKSKRFNQSRLSRSPGKNRRRNRRNDERNGLVCRPGSRWQWILRRSDRRKLHERRITNEGRYSFKNYVEPILPDDVRKKVQNLSKTPQKDDGTFFNKTNPQKGNNDMGQNQNQNTAPVKIENAAQLRSAYPDMINQIVDEAIQNERDRLKKPLTRSRTEFLTTFWKRQKYDEPLSAADLALAQMKSKQRRRSADDDKCCWRSDKIRIRRGWSSSNVGNDAGEQTPEQKEAKVRGFAKRVKGDKRRKEK